MKLGRSGGAQGDRMDRTKTAQQFFARFVLTWHRKVHFSTFSGKLTFQCSRNGPQDPPFCPGSLQEISIIEHLKISKVDPGKLVYSFSPRDGPVLCRDSGVPMGRKESTNLPGSTFGNLRFSISRFFFLQNMFDKYVGEISRNK